MEFQLKFAPFWILLLVFSKFIFPLVALNDEGQILISFKALIKEDPDHALINWNSSSTDPCSWNGIACKEGKVVAISLPKNRLLGTLSSSLSALPSLRHINLRSNRLQGTLPAGFLGAKLQSLVLSDNSFSGSLPPEIGSLFYLQVLDLSHNFFASSIPKPILQCKRLRILDLSNNNLTGMLPDNSWSNLVSLEKLSLAYNKLNGSIPGDIGNLSGLRETVDLSHNLFSGIIPTNLGNLPEKVYIDLAFNNLSGPIPQNGALVNRGPTAFIGNPSLCGPPLKNPCTSQASPRSNASQPIFPGSQPPSEANVRKNSNHRGLNKNVVVAIVVSDVFTIGLVAIILYYCYEKLVSSKTKEDNNPNNERKDEKNCSACFGSDYSETPSENAEQFDLIPLDKQVQFDLDELLKATALVLGRSDIGIVYKVVLEDGLTLAARRLAEGGTQKFEDFQSQVEAIGKVRHPNIVCLRAYYWSPDEKLLIYDYIPNGNLSDAINGNADFSPMPWDVRLKIMKGVAKGLAFLHEFSPKRYVHGDLRSNNILLGLNMEPYISDFGLGHLANKATHFMKANRRVDKATEKPQSPLSDGGLSPIPTNAFCYQVPDALKSSKPSQKWDVYSYGVILLELILGRSPIVLMDTSDKSKVQWIQLCISESKPLTEILDPCLVQNPEKEEDYVAVLKLAFTCIEDNQENRPSMKNVADLLEKLS